MAQNDPFFKLEGDLSKINQDEFYAHMDRSKHLYHTIYEPAGLDRRDNRTTRLEGKTFQWVSFSWTKIRNIIFRDCIFEDCRFIESRIERCEFHNCSFIRTNMHKVLFERTYIDPNSFKIALDPHRHQNIGVHLYQSLMNNSRHNDQPEFEADAHFYFLRWKRYQELYEVRMSWREKRTLDTKKRVRITRRFIWEWLFGSGIRLRHFIATVTVSILFITSMNYLFRQQLGLSEGEGRISSFIDAFYFSTITLTTLGFGDITPATQVGRLFVAMQGIIGFFLFALLASMLFRKIAP